MADGMINSLGNAAKGFYNLPMVRQLWLLVGLAASVALGVMVVLWSQDPNYRPVYSHLDIKDTSAVADVLEQANIKFKVDSGTGSILVPAGKVHDARLKVASSGLPKSHNAGFEILNSQQGIGTSRFMETARYKQALEGELARTISSFDSVRSARVHLAIPKQSVFIDDKRKPSASVLIDLISGLSLEKHQVRAIQQLVASSIPRLEASGVTVVDQQGRLLSHHDSSDSMTRTKEQFTYKKQMESVYEKHIEDILTPVLGHNKVRAKVSADIDFTHVERTQEGFDKDNKVLRTEQVLDEKTASDKQGGVAGAAANKPGNKGSSATSSGQSSKKTSTKQYEISKTISHTLIASGGIQRLSVAVVVDDRTQKDDAGKVTRTPLKAAEIRKITDLVKNAVGFNAERGDTVSIVNSSFAPAEQIAAPPVLPIWQQQWVIDIAKTSAAGLFILLLVFTIIRPMIKNLASKSSEEAAAMVAGAPIQRVSLAGGAAAAIPGEGDMVSISQAELKALQQQGQWGEVKRMANEDPERIAQVMNKWVGD